MLDGIKLDQVESENITIETQRHLLPTGSEMGHGNNQGGSANSIANFTYAGGKITADNDHNDLVGIRPASGTSSSFKLKQALAARVPASMNASQSVQ